MAYPVTTAPLPPPAQAAPTNAPIGSNLDQLYQTFLGQTNDALSQQQQPWQQELMASVNPEKTKQQNIRQAIAQASMALATTPGNFLQGLSAAAGTGANSYLQAQQGAQQDRVRALQLTQALQQKEQDRRLSLLMGAIGANKDLTAQKLNTGEAADRHALTQSQIGWYDRRGTGSSAGFDAASEKKRGEAAKDMTRWQTAYMKANGTMPTQAETDAQWAATMQRFGIDDGSGAAASPTAAPATAAPATAAPSNAPVITPPPPNGGTVIAPPPQGFKDPRANPALTQQNSGGAGVLAAPPPMQNRVQGQTYNTPSGPMTWTGNGWKPAV